MIYIRRICSLILTLMMITLFGCNAIPVEKIDVKEGFSVNILDVGEGDCFFIHLPDGKNLLIDTGAKSEKNLKLINSYIGAYGKQLHYMIFTYPHINHSGNGESVIKKYDISTIYKPLIFDDKIDYFPFFNEINKVIKKSTEVIITEMGQFIKGDNYVVAFLSPYPMDMEGSSYEGINGGVIPDERKAKDVSAVVYVEIDGVRFLFTGDISARIERQIVSDYKSGLYNVLFNKKGINIDLRKIDFLKISNHGDENSCCNELLMLTEPKTAIISVGGDNFKGHPSSAVLERLNENGCSRVLRTDVYGNITIYKENKLLKIDTDVN